jgi:8-amino-7-oxononanoate synthase
MPTLDFTSALYLGMRHPTGSLRPWDRFTTGVPAALFRPPSAERVERALAALQGLERSALYSSTLHLFWDLFGMLASRPITVHVDEGVYPIVAYGVERAAGRGAVTRTFKHHDAGALRASIEREAKAGALPIVVADGVCSGCGGAPPLGDYLDLARARGGLLIVDDTQALGLLGARSEGAPPYGRGGGGSLRYHGLAPRGLLLGSSLAKSFGVPVAALSGDDALIRSALARSETRVHTSPPSLAALHAAEHALAVEAGRGDALRRRLADNILHFRRRLIADGWTPGGGLFPVQTITEPGAAAALHARLLRLGVSGVLHRSRCAREPRVGFVITASHERSDLDACADALSRARREHRRAALGRGHDAKEAMPCG